jgi:hypothetical protein
MIFGLPQSGKSQRAATMAAAAPRVVFYDSMGHDYTDGVVVDGLPAFRDAVRAWYRNDRFRIIYRPAGSSREECKAARRIDPEFAEVCRLVKECADVLLVVDELQMYADGGEFDREFLDIVTHGRHMGADRGIAGVDLVAATQVPQGLGNKVPALVDHWYIFQTVHPAHLRFFRDICFGVDEADIRNLEKWQYIHYHRGEDSYWICRDNLADGTTERREREYLYDRAGAGGAGECGRDVLPVATVENDATNGPAAVPAP